MKISYEFIAQGALNEISKTWFPGVKLMFLKFFYSNT